MLYLWSMWNGIQKEILDNVYYTDANGKQDTEKNKYTKGCDGKVIKESFQEFRENRHLKLVGYVVKK